MRIPFPGFREISRPMIGQIALWPVFLRVAFQSYLAEGSGAAGSDDPGTPYWLLLPHWLAGRRADGHRPAALPSGFLEDVLKAQCALFLSIRVLDDVVDTPGSSRTLLKVAERLGQDSRRYLQPWFCAGDPFWSTYEGCIALTRASIRRADQLQRRRGTRPADLLRVYADVSAVFRVGSAAVCEKQRCRTEYRHIERFTRHIARADQILDDLSDILEDLDTGKRNYVARRLARRRENGKDDPLFRSRLVAELFRSSVLPAILDTARRHLRRAGIALQPLHLAGTRKYLKDYDNALHRARRSFESRGLLAFRELATGSKIRNR